MKIPNFSKGYGRVGDETRVVSNTYYAIFPNG